MKLINNEIYYSLGEVTQLIGKTRLTILRWYEFESTQDVKYLPEYKQIGGNKARYFRRDDLYKFSEFQNNHMNGEMAKISNKYNGVNKKRNKVNKPEIKTI